MVPSEYYQEILLYCIPWGNVAYYLPSWAIWSIPLGCVQSSALGLYRQKGTDVPDQTIPVASQMYVPKLSVWLLPKPCGDQCLLLVKGGIQLQRHLPTLTLRPLHACVYTRSAVSSQQLLEMGYRIWGPETPLVSSGHQCTGSKRTTGLIGGLYSSKGGGEGKPEALTWH